MILPALFAAALSFAEPCGTCSCAGPRTPESGLQSATAVFTGTVVSVRAVAASKRAELKRQPEQARRPTLRRRVSTMEAMMLNMHPALRTWNGMGCSLAYG